MTNAPTKPVLYLDPTQAAMREYSIGTKVTIPEALLLALRSAELTEQIASHRDGFGSRFSTNALRECVRASYGRRDGDPSRYHLRGMNGYVEPFLRPGEAFETGLVTMRLVAPAKYLELLAQDRSRAYHVELARSTLKELGVTHVITEIHCEGVEVDEFRLSIKRPFVSFDESEPAARAQGEEIRRRFSLVAATKDY